MRLIADVLRENNCRVGHVSPLSLQKQEEGVIL